MYTQATGKIVSLLDQRYGQTKSGKDFETREYLIELDSGSQYVHSVKFSMSSFDGPIQNPISVGDVVKVGLRMVARQYNGKWFNDVSLVQWEKVG